MTSWFRFSRWMVLVACWCGLAGGAGARAAEPAFDLAVVRARIEESNRRYEAALARQDVGALCECYTPDACLYAPQLPAFRGAAALPGFFQAMIGLGVRGIQLVTEEVLGGPDGVTEVGSFTLKDAAGKVLDTGRYLVHWKRVDGRWRMHRDIFNSDRPPAPAPPAK